MNDKPKEKVKESDIQKSCIDYLKYKNIFCFKIANTGTFKKATGSYIPSQTKGIPDLVMHLHGEVRYVEFKTPTGRMSEHQIAFKEECDKARIYYYIIRSLDELVEVVG